jgi:hypothetical protein
MRETETVQRLDKRQETRPDNIRDETRDKFVHVNGEDQDQDQRKDKRHKTIKHGLEGTLEKCVCLRSM